MIGFHLQGNSDNWPDAVAKLPSGAPVKFVDGVQRCVEAKAANPHVYTVVRHHVHEQNPAGDLHDQARRFFASFVDESFLRIARHVDAVQEWNEYFADSQSAQEKQRWIDWIRAVVDVWRDEYRTRPELAHIDLILAETAVGNDIPSAVAKIAHDNPFCVLGYHPYIPVWRGELHPEHWRWYSGRWHFMDMVYRAQGYRVRWFFGEFGAVGLNGPGWPNSLDPTGGWRHPNVYDGKLPPFLDMMTEWLSLVEETAAWQEGRVIGAVLFTSGGGTLWRDFEIRQPEMSAIAGHVAQVTAAMSKPQPKPQPPPEPPAPRDGQPRVQYARVMHVLPQTATAAQVTAVAQQALGAKQTVGFSYDDAGVGALDRKTAVLWGIAPAQQRVYTRWYARHYPGTAVQFRDWPETGEIVPSRTGTPVLDVSHWQGVIDWNLAASAGVDTVYIKATEAAGHFDRLHAANATGAQAAGIQTGAYHYYRNGVDPIKQASNFLRVTAGHGHTLPPALDIEDTDAPPDIAGWRTWLEHVNQATGVSPVIYTAAWYWNPQRLKTAVPWARDYRLWVADYRTEGEPVLPRDWDSYWLWQYGQADGRPYGVAGRVDVNRWG